MNTTLSAIAVRMVGAMESRSVVSAVCRYLGRWLLFSGATSHQALAGASD